MISHKVGDVIKEVVVMTKAIPIGTSYLEFNYGNNSAGVLKANTQYLPFGPEDWRSYDHLNYGKCYSYTVPKRLRHLKIRAVNLLLKMDTFVFVHHEGQFRSIDTVDKIPIKTGRKVFIDVKHAVSNTFFL
jgi:hypothetical protein